MRRIFNRYRTFFIYFCLALATIVTFESVRQNSFLNYDDDEYVTENPNVIGGLKFQSVIWAFTTTHASNWHPITWLSHMLDCELFGLNPGWHHLTNLLFHMANTLLLFWVLKKMTNAVWPSAFVAAAFALHPLHVESVAWVAERKDILSTFFAFLVMAAYVRYAEHPRVGRYLLVVVALALGLMAKPMLVTMPFVLLLLDYWPLGRLQPKTQSPAKASHQSRSAKLNCKTFTAHCLIAEKIPLCVLSAASCVITFIAQRSGGAVETIETLPLKVRILNALVSYVGYIGKLVYPHRLAPLYPHLGAALPIWQPVLSLTILVIVSLVVVRMARRRYLAVGWLWYVGTLVPVIGLVQVGSQAMADRYTYLPSIGFFIMVAWGVPELLSKWSYRKQALGTLAGLLLVVLAICTTMQLRHWRNNLTLFGHAVDVTENNYVMHNLYGYALFENNQLEDTLVQLREALRINPRYAKAYNNIGGVFFKRGDIDKAIESLNKALQLEPEYPEAIGNMGDIYYSRGKFESAIDRWTKVLRLKPASIKALNNLAWILATVEDPDLRNPTQAVKYAERACELTGRRKPVVLDTLAAAYAAAGRFTDAIATAEKALKLTESSGQNKIAEEIRSHLRLYKAARPYIKHSAKVSSETNG